jgi:hypothetical protein
VPPRDWRVRIEDMLDAAAAIAKFVQGTDFDAFRQDRKTVDAVVRNLEVIGEAARHVPDSVRERFSAIPWADEPSANFAMRVNAATRSNPDLESSAVVTFGNSRARGAMWAFLFVTRPGKSLSNPTSQLMS